VDLQLRSVEVGLNEGLVHRVHRVRNLHALHNKCYITNRKLLRADAQ
jgi:hypothetical protein